MTEKIIKKLYSDSIEIAFYPNSHRYKINSEDQKKELKDLIKEKNNKNDKRIAELAEFILTAKGYLISVTAVTGLIDKSRILMDWCLRLTKEFLYERRGDELTSILIDEAIDQKNLVQEKALSIGNQVHEFAEAVALYKLGRGEKPELPIEEEARHGAHAFLKWMKEENITFHDSERFCYSKEHDYVGTVDVLFSIGDDPRVHIGDFKTSKGVYADYMFQVAGYRIALEEEYGKDFGDNFILKFGKDTPDFEVKRISKDDYEKRDKPAFLGLLEGKKHLKVAEAELRNDWKASQK